MTETCPNKHPWTPENAYYTPILRYRKCKACMRVRAAARVRVSRSKAKFKPALSPAVVAQLRAAAGIPNPKGHAQ